MSALCGTTSIPRNVRYSRKESGNTSSVMLRPRKAVARSRVSNCEEEPVMNTSTSSVSQRRRIHRSQPETFCTSSRKRYLCCPAISGNTSCHERRIRSNSSA